MTGDLCLGMFCILCDPEHLRAYLFMSDLASPGSGDSCLGGFCVGTWAMSLSNCSSYLGNPFVRGDLYCVDTVQVLSDIYSCLSHH